MNFKSRGITLVELTIVIILLGFVVMAATSLDIASRRFFQSGMRETAVLNSLSVIMERMVKDLSQANGFEISISAEMADMLFYQQDALSTPLDDTDDFFSIYTWSPDTLVHTRIFPDTGEEIVATNIVDCTFTPLNNNTTLIIDITGRHDPSNPEGPDNPEMNLLSFVTLRETAAQ